jgi:hypothetical protein
MAQEFRYLESPQTGKLLDLVLQLATDLHVASNRIRVLEAALVRTGTLTEGQVDGFEPTAPEAEVLTSARDAMMGRLIRIITERGPAEHPLREQWEAQLAAKAEE